MIKDMNLKIKNYRNTLKQELLIKYIHKRQESSHKRQES